MTRSTFHDPSVDKHRLQNLLLSDDAERLALSWRKVDAFGNRQDDVDAASIRPGSTLRLDTFFNSFYERYWRDLTDLGSLHLAVATSGPCLIRVIRRCANFRTIVLAETVARGEATRSVLEIVIADLPLADAILYAEVEALDELAVFHDGAWVTDDAVRNDVRLAIVTCSFGREAMLVENLRRVADVVAQNASIIEFLIVHQGKADLATLPSYAALLSDTSIEHKLRLVRQDNFGGTGGFARGLLEVLDSSATHILLLDDDIRIEPWVLERLIALLARLVGPKVIGGQMLDLQKPTTLHASHESVRFDVLQLRNAYAGVDLRDPSAVNLFCRRRLSDYNAWWCCCLPVAAVRQAGFPIPMFIRHDDVEYGVRIAAAGIPTVTMPGIFIWHEPFTMKAKASTVYYEYRNFLIAAALHGGVRRVYFLRLHWRNTWGALRRHRFEYCWALCRAVDDFVSGPASVFGDLPGRHRDLTASQGRVTLMTMASVRYHSTAERRRNMRWRLSMARLLLFGRRGLPPAEAAFASTIRALAFSIVRTTLVFLRRATRAERAYRADIATYTDAAYWRDALGLSRDIR